jgi:hypothetical protein
MIKSGLIFAGISLLLSAGATLLSPFCVPCLGVFLGLGAGYLAGVFDKPVSNDASAKSGALGGVIGAVGALVGQVISTIINGMVVGPAGAARLVESLGLPSTSSSANIATTYWISLVGSACCLGLLNIALMAGFGALGAILWWQFTGKKNNLPAEQM